MSLPYALYRRICLTFLVAVLLVGHSRTAVAEEPLTLVGPSWPPFLYGENPRRGLASEIVIAAFAAVDQPVEMQVTPWRRGLWLAQYGNIDGLIGIWHADDREDFILFSEPYYTSRVVIAYHKDNPPSGSKISDLAGLLVGVREGAFYGEAFMSNHDMKRLPVSNDLNMLHMLAVNRLDAAVGDSRILQEIIADHPHLQEHIRLSTTPFAEIPIHFGAPKSQSDAQANIDAFNRGLRKIRRSGKMAQILAAYDVVELLYPTVLAEE